MSVHVGIIDQDPIRLITPLLDQRMQSQHIVLIGEENQHDMYQRLLSVLRRRNIRAEFFEIPAGANIKSIKSAMRRLAEDLKKRGADVRLNASCGLHHRLLSAYDVFRSYNWPVFSVEPKSDHLCWLFPTNQKGNQKGNQKDRQVQDHINIADYLAIFGAAVESSEHMFTPPKDAALKQQLYAVGEKWAKRADELGFGLATLNFLATTCRKEQSLTVELTARQQGYRELKILIEDLIQVGFARFDKGSLSFAHEDARRFANGAWLENFVYETVQSIQSAIPGIQDHAVNLRVNRQHGERDVFNELDVAAVVNNKLHIIECKTKGMRDSGDDTLYKLEYLRDLLGGLQARAMLISFRPLKSQDRTRAEELGLALIGPAELQDLPTYLTQWFLQAGGETSEQVPEPFMA